MKNIRFNLPIFATLLFALLSFTACKKDKLRKDLVGDWEVKSFTIDGVEAKGSVITSSKMEFEAYSGDNGDFEWSISYTDGSSETQTGDYTVDQEDEEITFEDNDGERIKLDFDLSNDDLELSGILDGQRVVIKAERD